MTGQKGHIEFEGSEVHYLLAGEGPSAMVVLHGYGMSADQMFRWLQPLSSRFRLLFVDLFFHGHSLLSPQHQPLSPGTWAILFEKLYAAVGFSQATVLGYSMGAKFALNAWQHRPQLVEKLLLIAPDGIVTSGWYTLATSTWVSRLMFKLLTRNPGWLFYMMRTAGKLGLVKSSILKFIGSQLNTQEKRDMAFQVWVNFRLLGLTPDKWEKLIEAHHTPVSVWLGKYDRVIVARRIRKALKPVAGVHVKEAATGHNDLVLHWVRDQLSNPH